MKKPKKLRHAKSYLPLIISLSITGIFLLLISFPGLFSPKIIPACANSITCLNDLSGMKEADDKGTFLGNVFYAPDLPESINTALKGDKQVLAAQSGDYKRIYVDLTNQRLSAFEGNNIIMDVPVSTGKWNKTPAGEFRIWIWLRYTRMKGGSGADYYDLPNVPYTMYFYNDNLPKTWGYSLHGTYWHNNFGHPMSHGCVNMRTSDAEKLFYWTNPNAGNVSYASSDNPGTLITIYGKTPIN